MWLVQYVEKRTKTYDDFNHLLVCRLVTVMIVSSIYELMGSEQYKFVMNDDCDLLNLMWMYWVIDLNMNAILCFCRYV
ncbi:hypothetical protein LX69_02933 [Breznakibacter xylanolyticus]|uniref:Uncharacterized protein n=1 Tax=Breznakibacter xylanolyticus TaxID=990 RepID=A0A2W7NM16_9BACT|nr:hypothetical protein LX69_02933 [Breznakibacter xylanolyticus]